MKIAIELSGLHLNSAINDENKPVTFTDWKLTGQNIIDTFSKYNPDYYIHSWNSTEQDDVLNFYNPKDYMIEEPNQFNSFYNKEIVKLHSQEYYLFKNEMTFPLVYTPHRTFSQFYGIRQVDLLRQKYELHHNMKYDLIIRCRFDLKFNVAINLIPNQLQFMPWDNSSTYFGLTDLFYAGTSKQMTKINNFYNKMYDTILDQTFINAIHQQNLGAMHLYSSHSMFYYYLWKLDMIKDINYQPWQWDKEIEIIRY